MLKQLLELIFNCMHVLACPSHDHEVEEGKHHFCKYSNGSGIRVVGAYVSYMPVINYMVKWRHLYNLSPSPSPNVGHPYHRPTTYGPEHDVAFYTHFRAIQDNSACGKRYVFICGEHTVILKLH